MKLINYIWVFIWLEVIKILVLKPNFVFYKLSQNSINDGNLVDTLCWIYFCKMYNDMKLKKNR